MSPPGYTAFFDVAGAAEGAVGAERLNDEPEANENDGWYASAKPDDEECDERVDLRSGKENNVGPQHAGDGAAGSQGGDVRAPGKGGLGDAGAG